MNAAPPRRSQSMFNLIYRGKGRMPGYGTDCAPKVAGCARCTHDIAGGCPDPHVATHTWHACVRPQGQCTFGPRSSDEDIRALVAYVLERAGAGWK